MSSSVWALRTWVASPETLTPDTWSRVATPRTEQAARTGVTQLFWVVSLPGIPTVPACLEAVSRRFHGEGWR